MGKKYLDTKKNTLEASILDVWKEAAKLNEYKTKLGEKKRVAGGDMRRTENKKPEEVEEAALFELSDEDTPELFNSDNNEELSTSPEEIKSEEEEDLEIPAFLRRQKN